MCHHTDDDWAHTEEDDTAIESVLRRFGSCGEVRRQPFASGRVDEDDQSTQNHYTGALSLYVECCSWIAWHAFACYERSVSIPVPQGSALSQAKCKSGWKEDLKKNCFPVVCIWVCVRGLDCRIYLFHIIIISFWIIVVCEYLFFFHWMYSFKDTVALCCPGAAPLCCAPPGWIVSPALRPGNSHKLTSESRL